MKIGLVGLSKSGKTSLFNLLTGSAVATSSFCASRGEMHAGVARGPDERGDRLSALFKPKKTTFAPFEVADLAGISKGERAGVHAKEFENADAPLPDDDARAIRGFTFLSQKPILHCLNLSEKEIDRGPSLVESFGLQEVTARPGTAVGWVSAVIEAEVAQLAGEEQAAFLADLGLTEPAIRRVLRDCYALLGLVSFFTVGDDEVRAWPIPSGTRAQDAAGTVHSDIARGFIRAEVNSYDDLVAVDGAFAELRTRGQLRLEGKDYVVRDGEICHFRFNVGK